MRMNLSRIMIGISLSFVFFPGIGLAADAAVVEKLAL